jgi:uncharacterized membrane protein YbhN (UPF0104 family)
LTGARPARGRALLATAAKVAVTLLLAGWLVRGIDWTASLARLASLAPAAGVGAGALLAVQLVLLGLRWHRVNRVLGVPLGAGRAVRLAWIGHFFNQVLPSGFAGDAARAWLAVRGGVPFGLAVRSVVCDRFLGLLALVALIAGTTLALPGPGGRPLPGHDAFRLAALATLAGLVALALGGGPVARALERVPRARPVAALLRDLQAALVSRAAPGTLALAVAAHAIGALAVAVAAAGMAIPLGVAAALFVVPAVLLVAMAPVSVAGWGVREGAMVVGLGFAGVAAPDALALSVAYGLLQVATGLVGGALWLADRDRGALTAAVRSPARSPAPGASAAPPSP